MKQGAKFLSCLTLVSLSVILAKPAVAHQAPSNLLAPAGCKNMIEEYQYALDLLFPKRIATGEKSKYLDVDYSIVVRYLPSFQTERQIVFEKRVDGKLLATEYSLPVGTKSVWTQLNKIYLAHRCPTDEEIKGIKITAKKFNPAPKAVKDLVTQLFQQPLTLVIDPDMRVELTSKSPRPLMEDGETVYFWLNGRQNSANFELLGPYGGSTHFDSPLYDELHRLRIAVENAQ